jgi:hypothetical protein
MMNALHEWRLDRTMISVGKLGDPDDVAGYWRLPSPAARLSALEYLRQVSYGDDAATARLQRVLEIVRPARR